MTTPLLQRKLQIITAINQMATLRILRWEMEEVAGKIFSVSTMDRSITMDSSITVLSILLIMLTSINLPIVRQTHPVIRLVRLTPAIIIPPPVITLAIFLI